MNFYERLSIPRDASRSDIYKRYMELVRTYHPDRFEDPKEQIEAQEKLMEFSEAYNTLRDSSSRSKYDEGLIAEINKKSPEEEAATFFDRGLRSEKSEDWHTAVECFKRACALDATKGQYFLHHAKALSMNPNWHKQAEENFSQAIALDPKKAEFYRALIKFYLRINMKVRAAKIAEQGLLFCPKDTEIKAAVGAAPKKSKYAAPVPDKKKGGLFGRWRKK